MKKALLQKKIDNKKVKCLNCAHYCTLSEEETGKCNMRQNKGGELRVYNYGQVAALNIDPIEKKPLYHFLPSTKSLSIATPGCSFSCKNCQNWRLSQRKKDQLNEKYISPANIVKMAKDKGVESISYTYGEPIIFLEYALDIMKLAEKENIKNVWVSNGYFSKESLEKVSPYIDAINIDLKSFSDDFYKNVCGGRLKPVLKSIKNLYNSAWLELTTLIIPGYNDSKKELKSIAKFIYSIDKNIPWHVSKFSSRFSKDMKDVPDTSDEILEKAYKIGKEAGLNYIYPGNIITNKTNTYCPQCDNLIIERNSYNIKSYDQEGRCSKCGQDIKIIKA
ncbi:MAG: AmmeMemoRadiSam system radical SAM enzyme [Patescibacteria group bacterium]